MQVESSTPPSSNAAETASRARSSDCRMSRAVVPRRESRRARRSPDVPAAEGAMFALCLGEANGSSGRDESVGVVLPAALLLLPPPFALRLVAVSAAGAAASVPARIPRVAVVPPLRAFRAAAALVCARKACLKQRSIRSSTIVTPPTRAKTCHRGLYNGPSASG